MLENKRIDLQQELEQMSSRELKALLDAETGKETPDDDLVLTAVHILEKREAGRTVALSAGEEKAWEKYQAKVRARTRKGNARYSGWLVRAASLMLVAGLVLWAMVPKEASAGSFWKVLTNWTDTIFQYVNIGAKEETPEEYVFQSDNPGLQQVYEAVVEELGVTEPVVVQWLPEGYVLTEIKVIDTPAKKGIHAYFSNGENEVFLIFDKMKIDFSAQYDKEITKVNEYELNGSTYNIFQNGNGWIINWAKQNIKCSIYINCQEEKLEQIVKSIY